MADEKPKVTDHVAEGKKNGTEFFNDTRSFLNTVFVVIGWTITGLFWIGVALRLWIW
jgi:hypothetical protein